MYLTKINKIPPSITTENAFPKLLLLKSRILEAKCNKNAPIKIVI